MTSASIQAASRGSIKTANSVTMPRSMVPFAGRLSQLSTVVEAGRPRAGSAGRQQGTRSPSAGRQNCRCHDECRGVACSPSAGRQYPFRSRSVRRPRGGIRQRGDHVRLAFRCQEQVVWRRSGVPDHRRRRVPRRYTDSLAASWSRRAFRLIAASPSRRRTPPWSRV